MNKKIQVFRQNDKESAAAEAGEHLNLILNDNKKNPILLMLSGGSTFSVLDYVGKTALGANITISVLDERFSQDPAINNFIQLQKTDFYNDAFEAECSFFGTLPRQGETSNNLATRWGDNLRQWREKNPSGVIITTLGMGPDGHTAGIFPFPENPKEFQRLFKNEPWVAAYNAANKNNYPERITTTLTFFKLIDVGLAFVCGTEKKEKLAQVLSQTESPAVLPALAWQEIKNVKIFTDIQN